MKGLNKHKFKFLAVFFVFLSVLVIYTFAAPKVTLSNNGSRLVVKAQEGNILDVKWQRAEMKDGTYVDIPNATNWFYDITSEDEGKYIRAVVDGETYTTENPIGKLVVFDLAKGKVILDAEYSGVNENGESISGTHESTNIYVIKQSDNQNFTKNNIWFAGHHQDTSFDVTIDGVNMGRESYPTTYIPNTQTTGGYADGTIDLQPNGHKGQKNVVLRLKNENIVRAIHYYTNGYSQSSLKITDINGDGDTNGGSLYVPVKVEPENVDSFVNSNVSYNHWNSAIGGDDNISDVTNFEIAGGKLQVLTTYADNCTAIGAGGNGYCKMTISGGDITAHCNGTGTAIGGGIGWFSAGGKADITITGGKIYAKNHGEIYVNGDTITTKDKTYDKVVGGVAIGSGSSFKAKGTEGKVTITGGTVEAYGTFGNGIGGGNSSTSEGGKATISISAGTVTATSIGGGNSKDGTGGAAEVTVSGTADVTLLKGIGGGDSISGTGGEATIHVTGGKMNCAGVIGGGNGGTTGDGGKAKIIVEDGILTAKSIGGGTGSVGGHGGAAEVTVSGGTIKTGSIGGGSTLNTTNGKLGYAKAKITGGDISGQFLMAAGGTEPCSFVMTGGLLHDVDIFDTSTYNYVSSDGAVVFMDDPNGEVHISGGTIEQCSAQNGGAIYMTAGTCTISGSAMIQKCQASASGGAIYMGGGSVSVSGGSVINNKAQNNGGGIAINNGNYRMTGGAIDGNVSENGQGGGIYVGANGQDVKIEVLSGSVSQNKAQGNGGAFAVVGKSDGTEKIDVTVGVNKNHFDENGELLTECEHGDEGEKAYTCPVLEGNQSGASGGGIFVTGNTSTELKIFCLLENGSVAEGDKGQSHFMKVEGGKVMISSSESADDTMQDAAHGNVLVTNEIYVTGGQMDIWGDMTNPRLKGVITVDIKKDGDHFEDHRKISETDIYYKLIYFENFTDPITNITTGQYKEVEVVHGTEVTISGNIYSHPGYTIKGWNTANGRPNLDNYPQGTYENDRGWYAVGENYMFDDAPIGDLKIYAIWEANGYTVVYDANVPPGETYTGHMEDYNFTYDLPIKLSKNQYARPGYEFIGWSKNPEGPKEFDDEQEVINLTTKKGEVVVLYAQWLACDHDPIDHVYTYSVIDEGKTLKRECSCGNYSEEARLSAEDEVYDQKVYPAEVEYTSEKWKPTVEYTALDGDELVDGLPYHAGRYEASVSEGGCTAKVCYTILKKDQEAPPKPIFVADKQTGGSVLSVEPVIESEWKVKDAENYKSYPEYRIVYYDEKGEHATKWQKAAQELIDGKYAVRFELSTALTNYYVQARYSECDDYNASPISSADSVYFFVGNVEFVVKCGEGIRYDITTADGTDVTQNGIQVNVTTEEGYFFPIGYTASILTEKAADNAQATLTHLENTEYNYSITTIPKDCKVTLTLPDAQKQMSINAYVTEKQIFGNVTTEAAVISRDSAYTAYFDVNDYSSSEYEPLKLTFSENLPYGTTIIMQDKNGGYYWLNVTDPKKEFGLGEFIRMGAETPFELQDGNLDLQFVVDFSQTVMGGISSEMLTTTLQAAKKTESKADNVSKLVNTDLKNTPSYELTLNNSIKGLSFTEQKSLGAASKWDDRDGALVFKRKTTLPADAHLSIVCGDSTTVLYANADGNFIYAMPNLTQGDIQVSFISNLASNEGGKYSFDVMWMISNSKAELSPMNGANVDKIQVDVEKVEKSPISLKIVGDKKLYNTEETVKATVSWADLQSNHNLEVVLMVKSENGTYSSTAVTKEIAFENGTGSIEIPISLAGNQAGSYRLQLTAELGLITVAEAEYYFIVE